MKTNPIIPAVDTGNFYIGHKTGVCNSSERHYHDSYEIVFYIDHGAAADMFVKDKKYEIGNGDLIFIKAFNIHSVMYKDLSAVCNRYVINFKKEYITECSFSP